MPEKKEEKQPKGNVVLDKFKKDQIKEDKNKKWNKVDDAVHAARKAYTGGYESHDPNVKTVSFEKALGDLIEVLQKIKDGDIKLGGLGEDKEGIAVEE